MKNKGPSVFKCPNCENTMLGALDITSIYEDGMAQYHCPSCRKLCFYDGKKAQKTRWAYLIVLKSGLYYSRYVNGVEIKEAYNEVDIEFVSGSGGYIERIKLDDVACIKVYDELIWGDENEKN